VGAAEAAEGGGQEPFGCALEGADGEPPG
jgi:hypothetical protein